MIGYTLKELKEEQLWRAIYKARRAGASMHDLLLLVRQKFNLDLPNEKELWKLIGNLVRDRFEWQFRDPGKKWKKYKNGRNERIKTTWHQHRVGDAKRARRHRPISIPISNSINDPIVLDHFILPGMVPVNDPLLPGLQINEAEIPFSRRRQRKTFNECR
jgi:hypothetical protein